ncbi:hypothetical protein HDU67_008274 [Dinochytrium kinnereticum]|nr:hypothetical protein HDU67_008274 [Dinochytrium kinnereticum]
MVTIHLTIINSAFARDAHHFLRFLVQFKGYEKAERSDVSASFTEYPNFLTKRFIFSLPKAHFIGLKPTDMLARIRDQMRITVTGFAVDKAIDGSASVSELGSCTLSISDFSQRHGTSQVLYASAELVSSASGHQAVGRISLELQIHIDMEENPGQVIQSKTNVATQRSERSGHIVELERENSDGGYGKIMLARSLIDLDHSDNKSEGVPTAKKEDCMETGLIQQYPPGSSIREDLSEPIKAPSNYGVEASVPNKTAHRPIKVKVGDLKCETPDNVSEKDKALSPAIGIETKSDKKIEAELTQSLAGNRDSLYENFVGKDPKHSRQAIIIFIHDVWDLPLVHNPTSGDSALPLPFVSVKSTKEFADNSPALLSTHASSPSREAVFSEKLVMYLDEPYSLSNTVTLHLSISDHLSKRYIAKFNLPISCLFFPTYRQVPLILRSISPSVHLPSPHLRISAINIDSSTRTLEAMQKEYTTKMIFLDFLLKGLEPNPLPLPMRCIAVLKVVRSGIEYSARMRTLDRRFEEGYPASRPPSNLPVTLEFDSYGKLISDFPLQKHASVPYLIYDKSKHFAENHENFFQITCSSALTALPKWNQHFLFCIPMKEYTTETSLVIEFFNEPICADPSPNVPILNYGNNRQTEGASRPLSDMIAYSIIPLGDLTIIPMTKQGRILPLSNIKLNFVDSYKRLPGAERVFCSLDVSIPENWNEATPIEKNDTGQLSSLPTANISSSEPGCGGLSVNGETHNNPPDNLEVILDDVLNAVKDERENSLKISALRAKQAQDPSSMIFTFQDIEQRQRLIDRLLKELADRTEAVKRVGQDLFAVRERNATLERNVKDLERTVKSKEIKLVQLMNTVDIEAVPHDDLKKRYVVIAQRLNVEMKRGKEMENRIESLSNMETMKLELERKYNELQQAHTSQQSYVQKLQVDPGSIESGVSKLLLEENSRLKSAIQELRGRDQNLKLNPIEPVTRKDQETDIEYTRLLLRAEVAEIRVAALEAELARRADEFAIEIARLRCSNEFSAPTHFTSTMTPPLISQAHPKKKSKVRLNPIDHKLGILPADHQQRKFW